METNHGARELERVRGRTRVSSRSRRPLAWKSLRPGAGRTEVDAERGELPSGKGWWWAVRLVAQEACRKVLAPSTKGGTQWRPGGGPWRVVGNRHDLGKAFTLGGLQIDSPRCFKAGVAEWRLPASEAVRQPLRVAGRTATQGLRGGDGKGRWTGRIGTVCCQVLILPLAGCLPRHGSLLRSGWTAV